MVVAPLFLKNTASIQRIITVVQWYFPPSRKGGVIPSIPLQTMPQASNAPSFFTLQNVIKSEDMGKKDRESQKRIFENDITVGGKPK